MLKQPATYAEQMIKLRENGCIIIDDAFCEEVLSRINYYRFSAYLLTFKMADGTYAEGTSFEMVYRLYEFDRKLRRILFPVIEELEVYLRAQLSYFHSHKYGADGYMQAANYNKRHNHAQFIARINDSIKSNSKIPFVKHHVKKYGGKFPIWAIIELFTFGMLSYFYADMVTSDQKKLAHTVFNTSVSNAKSWLYCCTNLRNICAHSRRLYNSSFSVVPAKITHVDASSKHKLFASIIAVKELYPSIDKWNSEFMAAMSALLDEYSDVIQLDLIGFPADWEIVMAK